MGPNNNFFRIYFDNLIPVTPSPNHVDSVLHAAAAGIEEMWEICVPLSESQMCWMVSLFDHYIDSV